MALLPASLCNDGVILRTSLFVVPWDLIDPALPVQARRPRLSLSDTGQPPVRSRYRRAGVTATGNVSAIFGISSTQFVGVGAGGR